MNGYEKIIKTIREESKRGDKPVFQIGTMTSSNTCSIGSLDLDQDNLYISEHLTKNICSKVSVEISEPTIVDKSTYIKPLESGDKVLIVQITSDKFVIIERLVSA